MKKVALCLIIFFASICLSYFYGSAFESHPVISDELAYQFQSQTFINGRVTNQTPASPEHFESQGLLVEPTFSSKYPPLLAAGMALGEKFFGNEHLLGQLGLALSCCLIFLILIEFFSLPLSFSVSLIATLNSFYIFEFANSYRPASLSLLAACLVYYGCLRSLKMAQSGAIPSFRSELGYGLIIGLGLGMLALSRPFIGALTFCVSVALYFYSLWIRGIRSWIIPFLSVILLCGSVQLFINSQVTHNIWKHPHSFVSDKYYMNPGFNFLSKDEPRDYRGNRFLERYYREYEKEIFERQTSFSGYIYEYFVEKIHKYLMFHTTYYLLPFLLIGFVFLILATIKEKSLRLLFLSQSIMGYFVASLFVVAHLYFYTVTITPIFFLLIAWGVSEVLKFGEDVVGKRAPVRVFVSIFILFAVTQLNMRGFAFAASRTTRGVYYKRNFEKALLIAHPNKKLVIFSKFDESHSIYDNWIYSDPNLNETQILWVTDLGKERNQKFLGHYPERLGLCARFSNSSPVIDPQKTCY